MKKRLDIYNPLYYISNASNAELFLLILLIFKAVHSETLIKFSVASQSVLPFCRKDCKMSKEVKTTDANKYLGALCWREHNWNNTGQSLRLKSNKQCVACNRMYQDEYREQPEVTTRQKEYHLEYDHLPISVERNKGRLGYWNEYNHHPDVEKRRKEHAQLPEIKERTKKHNQLPEVKKRKNEINKKYRQAHPEKGREKCRKRNALKREVYIEDVPELEIFERDNYICQICRKKVVLDKKWPHPLSPTLDHIVPLSCGGEHSKKNVRIVHLKCNLSKGNRCLPEGEQLLLFG